MWINNEREKASDGSIGLQINHNRWHKECFVNKKIEQQLKRLVKKEEYFKSQVNKEEPYTEVMTSRRADDCWRSCRLFVVHALQSSDE